MSAELKKTEKLIKYDLADLLRARLLATKYADTRSFRSKHFGSRYYPSINERRRSKKLERMNRKAGRT